MKSDVSTTSFSVRWSTPTTPDKSNCAEHQLYLQGNTGWKADVHVKPKRRSWYLYTYEVVSFTYLTHYIMRQYHTKMFHIHVKKNTLVRSPNFGPYKAAHQ